MTQRPHPSVAFRAAGPPHKGNYILDKYVINADYGRRGDAMAEKIGVWIFYVVAALIVLALLLFTPFGGIVKVIGIGLAVVGAIGVAFSPLEGGPKIVGVVGLVLLAIALQLILPAEPRGMFTGGDSCIETRSNPC